MFDLDKAITCVDKMDEYFRNGSKDADVLMPKEIVLGSTEHIVYIFYSCLLDYGMRSKVYHNNLVNTYIHHKEIFNPEYVIKNYFNKEDDLLGIIKESIHPRYPSVAVKKWLNLSIFINDNYANGKLIEKIKSLSSYKELYKFITDIHGYGQKTGGLLLRLIYESGICNFNDELDDIPIDRHDIEISYLNGVVNKSKLNEKELKKLGDIWIQAARSRKISVCDIDKYLWSIGNSMCAKKKCDECPLRMNCKRKV